VFSSLDKPMSKAYRDALDDFSHEGAHHLENIFHRDKRATHEKDLDTHTSFESLFRLFLTVMLRGGSFRL
jgi:hypothetical protein